MITIKDVTNLVFDSNLRVREEMIGNPSELDQAQLLNYLRNGIRWVAAASLERCEICGEFAGPRTWLIDGCWLWPKFIIHYVEVHGLQLPAAFLDHIRAQAYIVPVKAAELILSMPHDEISFE